MNDIEKLQKLINGSRRIVFFGGAGVSTESGIKDFRSVDGLYSQKFDYPPETILSHSFFMKNTEYFYKFYREKLICRGVLPNDAHKKLAEFEKSGKLTAVITQNIDGLHQAAGSQKVLELHGSIMRNYCMKCHKFFPLEAVEGEGIPRCECGGIIKPDVVLYEEPLDDGTLSESISCLRAADLVIVGGTSLTVYPAAGLLGYTGAKIVLINRDATYISDSAELVIREPIGKVMSQISVG